MRRYTFLHCVIKEKDTHICKNEIKWLRYNLSFFGARKDHRGQLICPRLTIKWQN